MTESENPQAVTQTKTRKGRRQRSNAPGKHLVKPIPGGIEGGRYRSLGEHDQKLIDQAARETLQRVGMSEAPDAVIELVCGAGGKVNQDGRLVFPASLIERALQGFRRNFTLYGQQPGREMLLGDKRVHMGSGGAAPRILDLDSGRYRDSTLQDLYDAARLVDHLENVHFFSRSMVARDMPDLHSMDINTAYASLSGTSKHVLTSISSVQHVAEIADLCFCIAGSREAFLDKPFLSLNINHVVPPLRYDAESCAVMIEAARIGIPVHANTFGQMGASSPVTMAGSVAQTIAETLSGMILAWLVNPEACIVFGSRPMITDLRTGGMSGGSGEQALVMAAVAQMAQYYDLANSSIAGATDSKIGDAQSGFEKCLTVSLAAQAGSNLITQACGMQASLMGCALESYVIDNDMLGSIMSTLNAIEVNDDTLNVTAIDEVVHGEGHFLGRAETLQRMQSDFVYPHISDRRGIDDWQEDGARDMRTNAIAATRKILASHFPTHISAATDELLRSKFDIRLARSAMEAG